MRRQRTLILLVTFGILAVGAGLGLWRGWEWHQRGWTGIVFLGGGEMSEQSPVLDEVVAHLGLPPGLVVDVAPGSPAAVAGFQPFDLLVAVRPQNDVRIVYLKDDAGRPQSESLDRTSPWSSLAVVVRQGEGWILACGFLLLGAWVGMARPGASPARVFFYLCAASAVYFFGKTAWSLDLWPAGGALPLDISTGRWLLLGAAALWAPLAHSLVLHLSLVFPRPHRWLRHRPRRLGWVYLVPLAPLAVAVLGWLGLASLGGPWQSDLLLSIALVGGVLCVGAYGFVLLLCSVAMGWLWWCSYRDGDRKDRQQLVPPVLVLSVALLVPLLIVLVEVVGLAMSDSLTVTSPSTWQLVLPSLARVLAYLATPVAFAYCYLRWGAGRAECPIRGHRPEG